MLKVNGIGDFYVTPLVVFAVRYKDFYPYIKRKDDTLAVGINRINDEILKNKKQILNKEQISQISNFLEVYKQK